MHWLTQCTHPEASAARAAINDWYRDFPDRNQELAHRLRCNDDFKHLQALDELFTHHLLAQAHRDVRYEEGGKGPDFRVYQHGTCILAVEIATLFTSEEVNLQDRRHNRLTDWVNDRIRPTHGYFVHFEIKTATGEPAPSHFTQWLERRLSELPPHTDAAGEVATRPQGATYEHRGLRIAVEFLPMRADAPTKENPNGRIVGIGNITAGFVNSAERLRDTVKKKGGGRYNIRGVPYVVVVGNRDHFLADEDVIDSLYGSETVRINISDPSQYVLRRSNDGLFGIDPRRSQHRNQRVSAVGILNHTPGRSQGFDLAIYENIAPEVPLPDAVLPATRRFKHLPGTDHFGWA